MPGTLSGKSELTCTLPRTRVGKLPRRYSLAEARGSATISSSETWNAIATACSTASVGLPSPDSRLAQVARGRPESLAICCWVKPRAWRSWRMLRPRRLDSSSLMGWHSANSVGRMPIPCQGGPMLPRARSNS